MTHPADTVAPEPRGTGVIPYAVAVFVSAGLVFSVQPMVARMILPTLGGSAAVWNVCMAFFQTALLAGYAYAHLLQRIPSPRVQMAVHLAVLVAAAAVLPLRITGALGEPSGEAPALWLAGVLTLSVGLPFAALSATAPLIQAWYARTRHAGDPYRLYAASNLGSLLALLAYPLLIEPLARLTAQSFGWTAAYGAFTLMIGGLALTNWRAPPVRKAAEAVASPRPSWRRRLIWLLLAAGPSSLLLGVTGHLTADVASAPFLWVIPLALYLVTFIIAFQARPLIPAKAALLGQAAFVGLALLLASLQSIHLLLQLGVHLLAFFFTALVCAQALAASRPPPARLTEFYLWLSIGGVVGGAFNAFIAPVVFNSVWEYPIVLVLAGLARPWGRGPLGRFQTVCAVGGLIVAGLLMSPVSMPQMYRTAFLGVIVIYGVIVMRRAPAYALLLAALAMASYLPGNRRADAEAHRSFFGVVGLATAPTKAVGPMRIMVHGSTLHGAQALDPAHRCQATTYYAPATPIGQAIRTEQGRHAAVSIGAVGLGTGTVASYVRPADHLRFFEIDPLVARLAFDPARFTFVRGCAKGPVELTLGDARLTLEKTADASFDVLLVDAFSSDSVPVHLLTVEAMRTYLRVIKPGGVVILHLSNRNLELTGPAAAAMVQAGAAVREQTFHSSSAEAYLESPSQAMVAARDPAVLAAYGAGWTGPSHKARAWTDDYTNVAGALWARLSERWAANH